MVKVNSAPARYQVRLKTLAASSSDGSANGGQRSDDSSGSPFSFAPPLQQRSPSSSSTWWYSPQALRPRAGNPRQCSEALQAALNTVEALLSGGSGVGNVAGGEKPKTGKKLAARLERAREIRESLSEAVLAVEVQAADETIKEVVAFEAGDASSAALEAGAACEAALKKLKQAVALAEGKGASGAMMVRLVTGYETLYRCLGDGLD